jgi:putative peptidoglycan binding protein
LPRRRKPQADVERGLLAATIARHPREFVGVIMGGAATFAILVNALFLQHGPHPAPIFATRPLVEAEPQAVKEDRRSIAPVPVMPKAKPNMAAAPAHQDPIAELIAPLPAPSKPHMLAIQHALADFGYGQIKPTGVYDNDTRTAIEKFERERNLPADGQVSDRFVRELAAMTGRSLE